MKPALVFGFGTWPLSSAGNIAIILVRLIIKKRIKGKLFVSYFLYLRAVQKYLLS